MNPRELAAAYVLEEMDAGERAEFERRLAREPELRAEVEALTRMTGRLGEIPADGWPLANGAELAEAGAERVRSAPSTSRRRPRLAFSVAAVAIAFIAGGALGAVLWSGGDSTSTAPAPAITLHALQPPRSSQADISMPKPETMLLKVHGLPHTDPGHYYEVWLMTDASSTVPVASFRVGGDGEATVEVPLPADPADFRYFDVSRQTVAGGTAHSDESVLRGSTS